MYKRQDYFSQGINGKNSEFHAAMGLCNLPMLEELTAAREKRSNLYTSLLSTNGISRPVVPQQVKYNYAYYPIVFESETILLKVKELLFKNEVNTRRYFYPSLNNLPFLENVYPCPVSEDIAKRVLCLPMYFDLEETHIERICNCLLYTSRCV